MGVYDINGNEIASGGGSPVTPTASMALGAATLLDKPIPRKMSWELPWHGSDTLLQQGVCVAGNYIVSAWRSLSDKINEIYFIDKETMQLATLTDGNGNAVANPIVINYSSSTTPPSSHANSLTYMPDQNAVYINSMEQLKCYKIELTNFTLSTVTLPVKATAFAYDPVTQQWCYVSGVRGQNYTIRIYAKDNTTLNKTLTIPFKNAQQGCMFYNGLFYLVKSELDASSPVTDNVIFENRQSILAFDTEGNLLKTWWFGSKSVCSFELEDMDIIAEGKVVISTNYNEMAGQLYEMQIMPENNSPQKTMNDTYDIIQLDQRTEFMTCLSGVDLNSLTYDGRFYVAQDGQNTNLPIGITSGWVSVFNYRDANNAVLVCQIMHDGESSVIASRFCNDITAASPVWTPWDVVNNTTMLKVLACGDSICKGTRNGDKGFVGDLGCDYKNIGVVGATLSSIQSSNIPNALVAETSYDPDVIIANGGINDYINNAQLGTVPTSPATTDSEASALNRNTVMGGAGYLFYQMVKKFPKAQRFFLITHKTYGNQGTSVDGYYPTKQNTSGYTQQDMHDALVAICKVYGVKVIDVYEDSFLNTAFSQYRSPVAWTSDSATANLYMTDVDGIHPTGLGYIQAYAPLIKQALNIGTAK